MSAPVDVHGLDAGARQQQIHHAAVDDRDALVRPAAQLLLEHFPELTDVLPIDLLERTEPLRVVGAAV
jgi:hypothetical protein